MSGTPTTTPTSSSSCSAASSTSRCGTPAAGERTIELRAGEMFVVPRGTEHKPSSPGGAILMFEPSGTSTTGDRHEGDIPAHVHSTTGVVADPGR